MGWFQALLFTSLINPLAVMGFIIMWLSNRGDPKEIFYGCLKVYGVSLAFTLFVMMTSGSSGHSNSEYDDWQCEDCRGR